MDATSGASRTAVLVCQGRAGADGRIAVGRFSDPLAFALLRAEERTPVEQVRADAPPQGAGLRMQYEMVRACTELMAVRTTAIDDAVRAAASPQVVILGAGLDARAWRMLELANSTVYEVDHPASQADKRERIGDVRPVCGELRYVPVDFSRDALGDRLREAGYDATVATTWVWEGVIPYLTSEQVNETLAAVRALSAPGSAMVANYNSTNLAMSFGRRLSRLMGRLAGYDNPIAREPWRSSWTTDAMTTLLDEHGFTVQQHVDLIALSSELGIGTPRKSLHETHVTVGMAR